MFDPALSLIIVSPQRKHLRFRGKKQIATTHLAEFRGCNISITNVFAEPRREVEKTPLIDVALCGKKY